MFHAQLNTLKRDIEVLKLDGTSTQFDILHDRCLELGQNKYETLQKVSMAMHVRRPRTRNRGDVVTEGVTVIATSYES